MTTLTTAIHAFREQFPVVDPTRPSTTRDDYRKTLLRCADQLGADRPPGSVTGEEWHDVMKLLWDARSNSTWNRNRAAVRSFLAYLQEADLGTAVLPALCKARPVTVDHTKSVDADDLAFLWNPDRFALRERALWRVLYESSSRADAVMSLDVPAVDFRRMRARAVIKGGDVYWVHFAKPGGQLLREYIGDRTKGPLWLTNRRPANWRRRSPADMAPDGRRYRLSYDRAEHIFKEATPGWTLHRLRHSRLTHLSEDGVDTPMLMAISGHTSSVTLHRRYARPGSTAVQKLFAKES